MKLHRLLVAAAIATGALLATASPASAEPVNFTPAYTVGGGAFPCAGTVEAFYDPDKPFYGPAIWMRPEFTFLPSISSAYCGVYVTVAWRNTDTGASGTAPANPLPVGDNTPFSPTNGPWVPLPLPTGKGHIEVTITTNLPSVPGSGSFVVS